VLRQWDTGTQDHIDFVIAEMLKKGLGANDRDSLTDMTALHFVCKAGALTDQVPAWMLMDGGMVWAARCERVTCH
jgi:hypothetical protein